MCVCRLDRRTVLPLYLPADCAEGQADTECLTEGGKFVSLSRSLPLSLCLCLSLCLFPPFLSQHNKSELTAQCHVMESGHGERMWRKSLSDGERKRRVKRRISKRNGADVGVNR